MTLEVRKKAKIRNRYSQAPHLTQDTTWESNKYTIKHHTQDSREVSPFPADDPKCVVLHKNVHRIILPLSIFSRVHDQFVVQTLYHTNISKHKGKVFSL